MFEQVHPAGREGAFDFTDATELGVTIAGELLCPPLVPVRPELQQVALGRARLLGDVRGRRAWTPGRTLGARRRAQRLEERQSLRRHAPDPRRGSRAQSAVRRCTRALRREVDAHRAGEVESERRCGEGQRHSQVVDRPGARASRQPRLRLRPEIHGVRRGDSPPDQRAEGRAARRERPHLLPLPSMRLPAYTKYTATVRQWSTIHFAHRVYSVPSRLIGCEVEIRQHPDVIEVFYRDRTKPTATMPRIRGERYHQIDYRHVIWSLVRKPGAFARLSVSRAEEPSVARGPS